MSFWIPCNVSEQISLAFKAWQFGMTTLRLWTTFELFLKIFLSELYISKGQLSKTTNVPKCRTDYKSVCIKFRKDWISIEQHKNALFKIIYKIRFLFLHEKVANELFAEVSFPLHDAKYGWIIWRKSMDDKSNWEIWTFIDIEITLLPIYKSSCVA